MSKRFKVSSRNTYDNKIRSSDTFDSFDSTSTSWDFSSSDWESSCTDYDSSCCDSCSRDKGYDYVCKCKVKKKKKKCIPRQMLFNDTTVIVGCGPDADFGTLHEAYKFATKHPFSNPKNQNNYFTIMLSAGIYDTSCLKPNSCRIAFAPFRTVYPNATFTGSFHSLGNKLYNQMSFENLEHCIGEKITTDSCKPNLSCPTECTTPDIFCDGSIRCGYNAVVNDFGYTVFNSTFDIFQKNYSVIEQNGGKVKINNCIIGIKNVKTRKSKRGFRVNAFITTTIDAPCFGHDDFLLSTYNEVSVNNEELDNAYLFCNVLGNNGDIKILHDSDEVICGPFALVGSHILLDDDKELNPHGERFSNSNVNVLVSHITLYDYPRLSHITVFKDVIGKIHCDDLSGHASILYTNKGAPVEPNKNYLCSFQNITLTQSNQGLLTSPSTPEPLVYVKLNDENILTEIMGSTSFLTIYDKTASAFVFDSDLDTNKVVVYDVNSYVNNLNSSLDPFIPEVMSLTVLEAINGMVGKAFLASKNLAGDKIGAFEASKYAIVDATTSGFTSADIVPGESDISLVETP